MVLQMGLGKPGEMWEKFGKKGNIGSRRVRETKFPHKSEKGMALMKKEREHVGAHATTRQGSKSAGKGAVQEGADEYITSQIIRVQK